MFSDKYNSQNQWGKDYPYKETYRKIFEAMVILRLIVFLCCGFVIALAILCFIPSLLW